MYTPILPWQARPLNLLLGQSWYTFRCKSNVAGITFARGMGLVSERGMIDFDALSYSWSRPGLASSIECNLHELPIPPAMADALRYCETSHRLSGSGVMRLASIRLTPLKELAGQDHAHNLSAFATR